MHDFVPEDLTTFDIKGNSVVTFFEVIGHSEPTSVKGAYYTQGTAQADKLINVFV